MEKRKMAKALVMTAALAGGTSLINPDVYAQGQTSVPIKKKYEWCQKLLMYRVCGYGNGLDCNDGQSC